MFFVAMRLPVVVVLVTIFVGPLLADDPLADRIERLETQMREIDAQLGKLDIIQSSLEALRHEDMQKLQRAVLGDESVGQAEPRSDQVAGSNGAGGNTDSESEDSSSVAQTLRKPLIDVNPNRSADPLRAKGRSSGSLEDRTRSLEGLVAALQQRYTVIDTIAEQLHLLRHEDLPKLNRNVRGLTETSKKTGRKAAKVPSSVVVPEKADQISGTVIVNNSTGASYRVAVNNQSHLMPPGRTTLKVPYGPIRTRLVDFEQEHNWPLSQWKKVNGRYELIFDLKN
jgi:hypothetical protein